MSWSHLRSDEVDSTSSTQESQFLGLAVHRLEIALQARYDFDDLVDQVGSIDADLIILRFPSTHVDWMGRLRFHIPDMEVIHADTLVYWTHTPTDSVNTIEWTVQHPPAASEAGEAIKSIFAGYRNHYAANPRLEAFDPAEAYRRWATNHIVNGGSALALSDGSKIVAVATLTEPTDHVEILLAGVVPEVRGRGVYGSLLSAVAHDVKDGDASTIVISTQAHNIGVQRAWARFGFLPTAAFDTLHLMRLHPSA
jgi:ribosomal protein S18 acetylase RimI-like enzyme